MIGTWVVFPETGGVVVTEPKQRVVIGELLSWNIVSENPDVSSVRLKFKKKDATFFPTQRGKKAFHVKALTPSDTSPGRSEGVLWGKTPLFKKRRKQITEDKYDIEGLNKHGKVVASLDPYILTDRRP